jgi:hypothetical protein
MTEDDFKRIKDLIEDTIAEYHCPPCEEDEWLTTKAILAHLNTSEPTLRKMRRNGDIQYLRVGQSYRYRRP